MRMSEPRAAVGAELALIGRTLKEAAPDATLLLVATRRSIEGAPRDLVSCARYELPGGVIRWAVVQRIGFQWSATVDLDADTAHTTAIGIARRFDG